MDREPNKSELRAKLFELLKTLSFRRGRVTLASGRQSDYYFDTKPTMLDAVGSRLLAELILQELKQLRAQFGFIRLSVHAIPRSPQARCLYKEAAAPASGSPRLPKLLTEGHLFGAGCRKITHSALTVPEQVTCKVPNQTPLRPSDARFGSGCGREMGS